MTPVGHSLVGLSIGWLVLPRSWSVRSKAAGLAGFVVLANAPDLPIPGWGHDRYHISHSLFVTALGVMVVGLLAMAATWHRGGLPRGMIVGGGAAWFSHLLLDTMYSHGKGLGVFWPLGSGRVSLGVPIFETMTLNPVLGWHNLRVFAIEGLVYGGVFALALAIRRNWGRNVAVCPPREAGEIG